MPNLDVSNKHMMDMMKIITEMIKNLFKKSHAGAKYTEEQVEDFEDAMKGVRSELKALKKGYLDENDYASAFACEFQEIAIAEVIKIAEARGPLSDASSPEELTQAAMVGMSEALERMGKSDHFEKIISDYSKMSPARVKEISDHTRDLINNATVGLGMDQIVEYVQMLNHQGLSHSVHIINNQTPESPDQKVNPELYDDINKEMERAMEFEKKARESTVEDSMSKGM